jgi:hypothetical protein
MTTNAELLKSLIVETLTVERANATERLEKIVEEVRERLGPKPRLNEEDWKRYAWTGASAALTAVLKAWEEADHG